MMNNKGQIGQIVTSFPVLIFVFLIMLIFVVISALAFDQKGLEAGVVSKSTSNDFSEDSILFEDVEIRRKQVWILDALLKIKKKEIDEGEFRQELEFLFRDLLDAQKDSEEKLNCLGIAYNVNEDNLWAKNAFPSIGLNFIFYTFDGEEVFFALDKLNFPITAFNDVKLDIERQVYPDVEGDVFIEYFYQECELVGGER